MAIAHGVREALVASPEGHHRLSLLLQFPAQRVRFNVFPKDAELPFIANHPIVKTAMPQLPIQWWISSSMYATNVCDRRPRFEPVHESNNDRLRRPIVLIDKDDGMEMVWHDDEGATRHHGKGVQRLYPFVPDQLARLILKHLAGHHATKSPPEVPGIGHNEIRARGGIVPAGPPGRLATGWTWVCHLATP